MKRTQLNLLVNDMLRGGKWTKQLFAETRYLNDDLTIKQSDMGLPGFNFSEGYDKNPIGNFFVERLTVTPSGLDYPLIVSKYEESVSQMGAGETGILVQPDKISYLRELEPFEMRDIMTILQDRFYDYD